MRSAFFLLLLPLLALRPLSAAAQRAHARVSPILVNPSSEAIGPTLRLSAERVDQSTITREDRAMRAGRDLRTGQDQAVATVRRQEAQTDETGRILARATAEEDRERHRRVAAVTQ
ncbi:MAG: hypothetical protein IJS32_03590 [Kiritimatiellae bacterium]|nr:hypothetical protein [Kiritimatiellia bacterium]